MNKPSSILVVVDGAQDASGLIEKALTIARQFGARVELFRCDSEQAYQLAHAYDREGIENACAESIAQARVALLDLKAGADAPDVEIAIDACCESPLYEAVARKVLRSSPDLVIKGLAGGQGRQHGTPDPNDWQLMRTCPATLMLSRRRVWRDPPRFAAVVDVSERETEGLPQDVMRVTRTLASPWQARVEVIYGETGFGGAVASRAEKLRGLCATNGVTAERTHVLYGPPEDSLPRFAGGQNYDVLVLGALTHRPAGTALVGTLTSKLLDALDCDFVLVKPSSYRSPIEERPEGEARATPARRGGAAAPR